MLCVAHDQAGAGSRSTGRVRRMVRVLAAKTSIRKALLALAALALAGVLLALSSGPAEAETFTVNKTGDAGDSNIGDTVCDTSVQTGNQCTLRAAIEEANANSPEADTINFAIGGKTTVKTIKVGSTGNGALPIITDPVTINGYTQRRARENTRAEGNDAVLKVQLNGANAGTNESGLEIQASNSTIKGLVINRFSAHGILIRKLSGSGATGSHVEGNFIGTNAKGTERRSNSLSGVHITSRDAENDAENNTIGGTQPAQRNVISGNTGGQVGAAVGAVEIRSSSLGNQGNQVLGNFIGTKASGTGDLGNGTIGVRILDAPNNTIGGTEDGARNIISGNGASGVAVSRGSPETGNGTGNKVEGNYIGTDVSGTQALGNHTGVSISGWSDNTVGGTAAGAGNTISGNDNSGVFFNSGEFNKVEGNRIGTTADGTDALPNGRDGMIIEPRLRSHRGGNGQRGSQHNLRQREQRRQYLWDGPPGLGQLHRHRRLGHPRPGQLRHRRGVR